MSAALVIRLSRSERERLERRQRRDRNAAVVRRITVVLLSDKGGAVKDICLATGVGPATVTNVRRRREVIVMDNARIHRAARTCEAIRRLGRWLGIFWLPSYSPDLNDIERVWKREKEHYFSNALPDSFEAFEARVRVRFRSLAHHGSRTITARSAPIRRIPMIHYNLYEAA